MLRSPLDEVPCPRRQTTRQCVEAVTCHGSGALYKPAGSARPVSIRFYRALDDALGLEERLVALGDDVDNDSAEQSTS